jgi:hypothetical protein
VQRSYFKKHGVILPCEASERKLSKEIVHGWVNVEMQEFVGEEGLGHKLEAPFGYIKDLKGFVSELLTQYEKEGLLNWHDGSIPKDQLWVKIGGDHGKGSFKLTMQVANLDKPNFKFNTVLIGMARVKDNYENVEKVMKIMKPGIESLKDLVWKEKKVHLFFFGDYEFLTKTFGLSGASGKHPCLWCLQSNTQIKTCTEHSVFLPRSLAC